MDAERDVFIMSAAVGSIFCLVGLILIMCAVTLAIAEGTFLGLLLGGIACLVMSVCCCVWVVFG